MTSQGSIVVLCGGVGAARMLAALSLVIAPEKMTGIVNVGDDFCLHGLAISPDLDTITYTLASANNDELGWGLKGESWNAMEALGRYGGQTWFNLGDKDLATHLYRTQRLNEGATLSEVTAEITSAWGLKQQLLPMTNDGLQTIVESIEHGQLSFQEYFVKHQHSIAVSSVHFDGAETAKAAPGVIAAIEQATRIIVAPSNPIVSIAPLLAIAEIRDALKKRREDVIAVSPIIAGSALKGPADRLLDELGHDSSAVGVAKLYSPWVATLVLDDEDEALVDEVEAQNMKALVTPTIMSRPGVAESLAKAVLK